MSSKLMMFLRVAVAVAVSTTMVNGLTAGEKTTFDTFKSNNPSYGVTITDGGSYYTLTSTGMPDHATQQVNPNSASNQNYNLKVPKTPSGSNRWCLPMGPIGVAVNGVPIFNPLSDPGCDAAITETFDSCSGHPTNTGAYHYHIDANCTYNDASEQLVGIAFDGFPIYGLFAADLSRIVLNSDLDACHGRTVGGNYRYYITTTWPYYLGCYRGSILTQDQSSATRFNVPTSVACTNTQSSDFCSCEKDRTYTASPGTTCSSPRSVGVSASLIGCTLMLLCLLF